MTTRTTSQILREITTAERKLRRYKALRKLLKAIIAGAVAGIATVASGVVSAALLWAFVPSLIMSIAVLAWVNFDDIYGDRCNVFEYLAEQLDLLREELATSGSAGAK